MGNSSDELNCYQFSYFSDVAGPRVARGKLVRVRKDDGRIVITEMEKKEGQKYE